MDKKDIKYIIKRVIIGVVIILVMSLIRTCEVHAAITDINLKLNDTTMSTNTKVFVNGATNVNLLLTSNNVPISVEESLNVKYGYIALCSAFGSYENRYINTVSSSSSYTRHVQIVNSTVGCTIPTTSDYRLTSRVIYITYDIYDPNGNFIDYGSGNSIPILRANLPFQFYTPSSNEFSLISFGFSEVPFNFNDTTDPSVLQNESIISNQVVINQNIQQQTQQQHQDALQAHQDSQDIKNSLTDTSSPSNLNALSNSAGWLPAGPVDSILNLPLSLLNNLSSNLSKNCQPVVLPIPLINSNITLPCVKTLYHDMGIDTFINWVGGIASAFILLAYLLKLYKWVDDTLTFRENNQIDNWGGI